MAIAVVVVLAGLAASIGGSYALALHALDNGEQQLCSAFELLTQRPVPKPEDPAANPSREQAYLFYTDLTQVEHSYRCQVTKPQAR